MGEKMTLAEVLTTLESRDLFAEAEFFRSITQPAQAVDGCELRTFAGWLREDGQHYWADRLDELADKLTAAIPNDNGKEDTDAAR